MAGVEVDSLSRTGLESELIPLLSLLHQGSAESQTAYRLGVKWQPAGVLLEQLLADITIVHSLPKCGGTTIAATLNEHPAIRPEALHLHYLSPKGLAFLEEQISECSQPNVRYLQAQLAQGLGARALLAANRALRSSGLSAIVRKPYLIAGVREPVALYLSLAFEASSLFNTTENLSLESLRDWVMSDPLSRVWDDWFTDELGEVSGVDAYSRSFPTRQGWDIYESETARVLIVRQENLDRLPDALGELYGLAPDSFAVQSRNVAATKDYAEHYARAKRSLRLTEPELDRVYATRFVRHFYTPGEIAEFKRCWRASHSETSRSQKSTRHTPSESHPHAPVRTEPACRQAPTQSGDTTPHPWVCRPCECCAQQLQSIPHLHKAHAEQAAHIQYLNAALARRWPSLLKSKLRSLARRLAEHVKAAQVDGAEPLPSPRPGESAAP
jgi:hypothetical protein